MLSLRKSSQHNNEDVCKWIPLPPLTKEWTDEEVYKHFMLSEEEIKIINDTNIIGYKKLAQKPAPKQVLKMFTEKRKRKLKIIET